MLKPVCGYHAPRSNKDILVRKNKMDKINPNLRFMKSFIFVENHSGCNEQQWVCCVAAICITNKRTNFQIEFLFLAHCVCC